MTKKGEQAHPHIVEEGGGEEEEEEEEVEEEEDPFDLLIVRPDQNIDCTSTTITTKAAAAAATTTSRFRRDDEDVSSLKDYELEEKIEAFRKLVSTMKMPDDNRKLRFRLQVYEDEKRHRMAGSQAYTAAFPVNGTMGMLERYQLKKAAEPLGNSKVGVFDQDCLVVACNMKERCTRISSPSQKSNVQSPSSKPMIRTQIKNPIHDLDPVASSQRCEDCLVLQDSSQVSSSSELGKEEKLVCSSCRTRPISAPVTTTSPDDQQREQYFDSPTRHPTQRLSSGKRLQRADGDTPDTALELSDEEENIKEGAISCYVGQVHNTEMSRRKTLRSTAKKRAVAKVLYPSSCDPEAVEVRYADLEHLAPLQFLNDTVIDFYIKYIQTEKFSQRAESLQYFHFYSCFFYKKLMSWKKSKSACFEKLHKWTKGINIFKKSYLLMPIHDSAHWSLAVICLPLEKKTPYILHLDSMSPAAGHSSESIYNTLKSYLAAEHEYLLKENQTVDDAVRSVKPSSAISKRVQVPLQDNEWDCGLFMLYYIERFIQEAPPHWDSSCLAKMFGRSWFQPTEASQLRDTILTLLESIFDQVCR